MHSWLPASAFFVAILAYVLHLFRQAEAEINEETRGGCKMQGSNNLSLALLSVTRADQIIEI